MSEALPMAMLRRTCSLREKGVWQLRQWSALFYTTRRRVISCINQLPNSFERFTVALEVNRAARGAEKTTQRTDIPYP